VWTVIPWDQVQVADGITYDGTNNRFVIPRAGRYHVDACTLFNPSPGSLLGIELLVNGTRRQITHALGTSNLVTFNLGKTMKGTAQSLLDI
jgi:hypothetical protein